MTGFNGDTPHPLRREEAKKKRLGGISPGETWKTNPKTKGPNLIVERPPQQRFGNRGKESTNEKLKVF